MSRRSDMTSGAPAKRVDTARALRDAGLTALLAFGLFLPLVGFETVTDVPNDLILVTRWPLLFAMVAIAGLGRLAYSLAIEPWLLQRAMRPSAEPAPWRRHVASWIIPFALGFVILYPGIVLATAGFCRGVKLVGLFRVTVRY